MEPDFKYLMEEIEKNIPKPSQMYPSFDEFLAEIKKIICDFPKPQEIASESGLEKIDELITSKYAELGKFQEFLDYRATLLRQQLLAVKD